MMCGLAADLQHDFLWVLLDGGDTGPYSYSRSLTTPIPGSVNIKEERESEAFQRRRRASTGFQCVLDGRGKEAFNHRHKDGRTE